MRAATTERTWCNRWTRPSSGSARTILTSYARGRGLEPARLAAAGPACISRRADVHIWEYRTPVEEVMRSLDDVVRSGKALYVAISDTVAWKIAQALRPPPRNRRRPVRLPHPTRRAAPGAG